MRERLILGLQKREMKQGLDNAAAIAFGNLFCEKKPIDWCATQNRDPTALLVIKLYCEQKLSVKTYQLMN